MQIKYKEHDRHILFNEDPDLKPIRVKLPKPPTEKKIIGYGLPHEEQVFKRPFIPNKLFELNKRKDISDKEKSDTLKSDHEYYEEESEGDRKKERKEVVGAYAAHVTNNS